jgi:hypothetical protein
MTRCVQCGSSRLDSEGVGCARCGGSPAVRWERCHINEDTTAKLLHHAADLQAFGVTLEEQPILRKDTGTIIEGIALVLAVAESLHPNALRDLVLYLRTLAIPEDQIIRLRLDEPEKISNILQKQLPAGQRKTSRSAIRKFADKRTKSGKERN